MSNSAIHFSLSNDATSTKDHGLFGPDSITWKVWSHPAAFIGLTRSFYIEVLGSIDASAALADRATYKSDPIGRLSRTMSYFLTVIFGDMETVKKANIRLFKLHSHIKGTTPLTGNSYSAHDPLLMLGTHLITWHSVYYAYEKLVGKLSAEEEAMYFEESVRYLESLMEIYPDLTIEGIKESALKQGYNIQILGDMHKLPSTRDEFRRYIQLTNQKAAITSQTREIINTLLDPSAVQTDDKVMQALLKFYPFLRMAVISLIPKEICDLAGIPRSPSKDNLAILTGKIYVNTLSIPSLKKMFESKIGTTGYEVMNKALQA